MRLALILFLLAAVIPVFFGKARAAPLWLGLQGIALGWSGLVQHESISSHAVLAAIETIAVRALIVPMLLRRAIGLRDEANVDLMPSNLFVWTIGVALIVLAFEFTGAAMADVGTFALGVVGATVAIALLLLATNDSPLAQLVAVLYMENAIAVFESLLPEPWPLPVHGALTVVYLATVGVGSWLIGTPHPAPAKVNGSAPTSAAPVPGDAS